MCQPGGTGFPSCGAASLRSNVATMALQRRLGRDILVADAGADMLAQPGDLDGRHGFIPSQLEVSCRGLSPASSRQQAPEQAAGWIPATSAGRTRCA